MCGGMRAGVGRVWDGGVFAGKGVGQGCQRVESQTMRAGVLAGPLFGSY